MSMNIYGGVNDMPDGFTKDQLGKRIYGLWYGMLRRCYDYEQQHRSKGKSYSNVIVCDRWFYLKNFYEDIQKLEGYDEWVANGKTMSLDKDINAQEVIKIYSPKTCKFVTQTENMQEMNHRCEPYKKTKEYTRTIYILFKDSEYKVCYSEKEACDFLEMPKSSISAAWNKKCRCKGWNVIRLGNKKELLEALGSEVENDRN